MARSTSIYRDPQRARDRRTGQRILHVPRRRTPPPAAPLPDQPSSPEASAFERRALADRIRDLQAAYRATNRPWVVLTSLGKDSTAAAMLTWAAIAALPAAERTQPVYLICGDTQVEIPLYGARIAGQIAAMNATATRLDLPFSAHISHPRVRDSFWVCVIGLGYAMPTTQFRWCTQRLKIRPNTHLTRTVASTDRVVCVLGVRDAESAARKQSNAKHRIQGHFGRMGAVPAALAYNPIDDWTADDVWTYLLQHPITPWGSSNRDLAALYRAASAHGECPLIVDAGRTSCGSGRFGCWCCTVASKNISLTSLTATPEHDWMAPLEDLYAWLKATTEPARKLQYRAVTTNAEVLRTKRREDGSPIPGRYRVDVRIEILQRLLDAQQQLRHDGPDPTITLIADVDLRAIRAIWHRDGLVEDDVVATLVAAVTGAPLNCPANPADDLALLDGPPAVSTGDPNQLTFF